MGAVKLRFLPLAAFGGVPHLTAQLFRSIQKAVLKEFLRRGLDFFVHFLGNSSFFFDFGDI